MLDYACKSTLPIRCRNVSKSELFGKTSCMKICQCYAIDVVALVTEKLIALNQVWFCKTRTSQALSSVMSPGSKSLCRTIHHRKRFRPDGPVHVATNLTPYNAANPSHAMTPPRTPKPNAPTQQESSCCNPMQLSRCASLTSTRQVTHLELPVRTWTRSVKKNFHCIHVHPCTACMSLLRPAVLAHLHLHQVQTEPCNLKHSYHTRTHLKSPSHEPHLPMAPSSDQSLSTPTPTDPDLQATPTYQNNPNLPPTPNMNSHTPNLHDQAREMEALEQIWSGLSLERSEEEMVSYVRIPVHPRTAMAWNQVTLPYIHSRKVDPTGFSGGIWLLWNESSSFNVEILTHSDHSLHALVKVNSPSLTFVCYCCICFS